MARLVAVCRSDDYPFERRQIPLIVDDNLTMVVQLNDTCMGCNHGGIKQKELERFVQKFHALTNDEVAVALMVTNKEIMGMLSQMVPCVGCRRSVEKLFIQLVETGHPALEPLVVAPSGILSIMHDYLFDPKAIYALFYVHGSKLNTVMDSIPKSKKNKRCNLHSLDSHKTRSLGSWIDIWDVLSTECREEVVLIECDALMDTLENYLRKHRFCSECKSKVLRAYSILVGDLDRNSEKGYCPALYEGLRCCTGERHVHVLCETDFIAHLISRAEPELSGSRRERHAKTLDIAQEEVLTCLGIHLYERLYKIWQKLRAEEQTWQILFYLGVDTLRKNFEVALEKKQGISNLELMCQELLEEEQAKEQKREQKRQKRKKKKTGKGPTGGGLSSVTNGGLKGACECMQSSGCGGKSKENCKFDENINDKSAVCASCDDHDNSLIHLQSTCPPICECDNQSKKTPPSSKGKNKHLQGNGCRSDCGYSSGHEGCETCSNPSSNDGSDIACLEGVCNHDGDSPLCHQTELPELCRDHLKVNSTPHSKMCGTGATEHNGRHGKAWQHKCDGTGSVDLSCTFTSSTSTSVTSDQHTPTRCTGGGGLQLSLQDMLEASCSSGEEDEIGISEEEIRHFKANRKLLDHQRQELRKTLRQRFDHTMLQQLQNNNTSPTVEASTSPKAQSTCSRVAAQMAQLSVN